MRGIKVKVNAKVNLSLNISGARADGMHLLDMVLTSVNLADVITVLVKEKGETSVAYSNGKSFFNDTALKAAELLHNAFPHFKADIFIDKGIPVSAGLGGSSADAAGVLFAIDEIFKGDIRPEIIANIAQKTGSDVSYLLKGGFARVQNTGEAIKNFRVENVLNLVICKDRYGVNTKDAYKKFDELFPAKFYAPSDNGKLIQDLCDGNLSGIPNELNNALMKGSSILEPSIITTLEYINQTNPLAKTMTGSGSACIALYSNLFEAIKAQNILRKHNLYAKAVQTQNHGMEILETF